MSFSDGGSIPPISTTKINIKIMQTPFTGAKIALLVSDQVLTILRDNKPNISFPNMWDLPGGARENNESPEECVTRETYEEIGLKLNPKDFIFKKSFPGMIHPENIGYFFVQHLSEDQIPQIILGNEGQLWKFMSINEFLTNPNVIEALKLRLSTYLKSV